MNKISSISDKYFSFQEKINNCIINFNSQGKLIKDSRNTIKIFDLGEIKINIKKFKTPNIFNRIAYSFFRFSKANRSFSYANRLLATNIPTPDPICYAEDFKHLLIDECFYVSKQIDYDFDMKYIFENKELDGRDELIRKFVIFTHNLHENGIMFLDHSTSNTIIKKIDNDYKFFLIDLNRMKFKKMNSEDRLKNFRRLKLNDDLIKKISVYYSEITRIDNKVIFEKIKKYANDFQDKRAKRKKIKQFFKL